MTLLGQCGRCGLFEVLFEHSHLCVACTYEADTRPEQEALIAHFTEQIHRLSLETNRPAGERVDAIRNFRFLIERLAFRLHGGVDV